MTDSDSKHIEALLIISSHCPHCPTMLEYLSSLIKSGDIAQLTVINIEQQPEVAQKYGVRSVPWIKLGNRQLQGLQTLETIKQYLAWAKKQQSLSAEFDFLLSDGQADQVIKHIIQQPNAILAILELLADEGTVLSTRIGIGVIMEEFEGSDLLKSIIPQLAELTRHKSDLIRIDACHYLTLTKDQSIRPTLRICLNDSSSDVREIAQEGLDEL